MEAVLDRAQAILGAGVLPRRDRAHSAIEQVIRAANSSVHRSVWRDPAARRASLDTFGRAVSEADRTIAASLERNGAVGEYPVFFAEHSVAEQGLSRAADCACGWPTRVFERFGRLSTIPSTKQTVCNRCGDIENTYELPVGLRATGPFDIEAGRAAEYSLTLQGEPGREYRVGLGFRHALRIADPPAAQTITATGVSVSAEFRFRVHEATRAETEYLLPFAVSDLAFTVGRVHIRVHPRSAFDE